MGTTYEVTRLIFKNAYHYKSSNYGKRKKIKTSSGWTSGFHKGTDFSTGNKKIPQYAISDGTILSCGTDSYGGKYAYVKYPQYKVIFLHYHLSKVSCKRGQKVKKGTLIGYTGMSGKATGIHLHLQIHHITSSGGIGSTMNPVTWMTKKYPALAKKYEGTSSSSSSGSSSSSSSSNSKYDQWEATANVNVRKGAGTNYSVVKTITSGTKFYVKATKDVNGVKWGQCSSGWVCLTYAKKIKSGTGSTTTTTTTTTKTKYKVKVTLNIRSGAGTGYKVVGSYSEGDTVTVTKTKSAGGYTWGKTDKGWIALDYCDKISTTTTTDGGGNSKTDGTLVMEDDDTTTSTSSSNGTFKTTGGEFAVKVIKPDNAKTTYDITEMIVSATWEGSASQASRLFSFNFINSNEQKFWDFTIEIGDLIGFYFGGKLRYVGLVEQYQWGAGTNEVSVTSHDFMNLLLKDTVSYTFKNYDANKITKKVCKDVGMKIDSLPKALKNTISKWVIDEENAYNVIMTAYYKEFKKSKVKYFPRMNGTKLSIIKKGESSGVNLTLGYNLSSTNVQMNLDNVCNKVIYYDADGNKKGTVKDADSIARYGVRQSKYTKEDKVDLVKGAKALLTGPTQEITCEALGHINATAGRSITLKDPDRGLDGKFWIEKDTHTFSDGIHTMSLTLTFKNYMENQVNAQINPDVTDSHVAYYSKTGKCYHSRKDCGGANLSLKTTVKEAKKLKKTKCSRCWN